MENQKPYPDPDLNIANLSSKLNVGPDYLSSILNGRLNKNFYDFVNHYRVEEFKNLRRNGIDKNITIMGLGWEAGFNSKATFNRVFKKNRGITPGQFIESISR